MSNKSFKGFEKQLESDLPGAFNFLGKLFNQLTDERPVSNSIQEKSLPSTQVTICAVCGGKKKLGNQGYEINCPECANCPTCGGSGELGVSTHKIQCPMCNNVPLLK